MTNCSFSGKDIPVEIIGNHNELKDCKVLCSNSYQRELIYRQMPSIFMKSRENMGGVWAIISGSGNVLQNTTIACNLWEIPRSSWISRPDKVEIGLRKLGINLQFDSTTRTPLSLITTPGSSLCSIIDGRIDNALIAGSRHQMWQSKTHWHWKGMVMELQIVWDENYEI